MPVYFIQSKAGGPIKIGYASTMEQVDMRLRHIQIGSPWKLGITKVEPEGDRKREKYLHKFFRPERLSGEWFIPCVKLAELADAIPFEGDDDGYFYPADEILAYQRGASEGLTRGSDMVVASMREECSCGAIERYAGSPEQAEQDRREMKAALAEYDRDTETARVDWIESRGEVKSA